MTKDELFAIVDSTVLSQSRKQELKTAVDRYSAALLQQTPCSTLREVLVQMLNKEQEAYAAAIGNMMKCEEHEYNEHAIMQVMKLIDALQPVA